MKNNFKSKNNNNPRKKNKETKEFYPDSLMQKNEHAKKAFINKMLGIKDLNVSVTTLSECLQKEKNASVKIHAIKILSKIGDKKAFDVINDALKDNNENVRESAIKILNENNTLNNDEMVIINKP